MPWLADAMVDAMVEDSSPSDLFWPKNATVVPLSYHASYSLGVHGYLPELVLWEYPGTYPSMHSGGTQLPTRVCTLGVHGYLPSRLCTLEGNRVPTRLCTLKVPGYLPEHVLWGYTGTYASIILGLPGCLPEFVLSAVHGNLPE